METMPENAQIPLQPLAATEARLAVVAGELALVATLLTDLFVRLNLPGRAQQAQDCADRVHAVADGLGLP